MLLSASQRNAAASPAAGAACQGLQKRTWSFWLHNTEHLCCLHARCDTHILPQVLPARSGRPAALQAMGLVPLSLHK